MKTFPVGTDAVVEIAFLDNDGNPVTPTALSYVVKDGEGQEVVALTPIADLTGTSTDITVPNGLIATPGGYSIELFITVADGQVFVQEEVFSVKPTAQLQFLVNTFQTRANALYVASQIPNLTAWMGAGKDDQTTALIESFRRLSLLNYVIPRPEVDAQDYLDMECAWRLTPRMWPLMTTSVWQEYPAYFKEALNRAQVIQANQLMTFDPMADRRRAGVFSEKIGESSLMFKNGVRPLEEDTVCRPALNVLAQFINNRISITRS
ncbi:hypothetical protein IVB12_15990 [Bradyrhizobium sp. 179]|uniref:hypothetical protein n=1 Tax=Bradyrhizobium sp. 179 TaxID=2782648 RepID=UPI001FF80A6F|nr:hypothetical protein [Bradyrhizobium sp. 179]MCK1543418.1 hypothetical protein [Bradyrhizobium sp. 179]